MFRYGPDKQHCYVCNTPTKRIDIINEMPLCGPRCDKKFQEGKPADMTKSKETV